MSNILQYASPCSAVAFLISALFWVRASRVSFRFNRSIAGIDITNLPVAEKLTCLFYTPNSIRLDKSIALSSWLNSVAAMFAALGAFLSSSDLWMGFVEKCLIHSMEFVAKYLI